MGVIATALLAWAANRACRTGGKTVAAEHRSPLRSVFATHSGIWSLPLFVGMAGRS